MKLNSKTNEMNQKNDMTQTAIISDCEVIGSNFQNLYINVISSVLGIVSYMAILMILNVYLALVVLISIPVFVLLNLKLSKLSKNIFQKFRKQKIRFLFIWLIQFAAFCLSTYINYKISILILSIGKTKN